MQRRFREPAYEGLRKSCTTRYPAGKIQEIGGFIPSFIKVSNNFAYDSNKL